MLQPNNIDSRRDVSASCTVADTKSEGIRCLDFRMEYYVLRGERMDPLSRDTRLQLSKRNGRMISSFLGDYWPTAEPTLLKTVLHSQE